MPDDVDNELKLTTSDPEPDEGSAADHFASTDLYVANQSPREPAPEVALAFATPHAEDGDAGWKLLVVDARESLSDLYEAVAELVTSNPTSDANALLGERATIDVVRGPRRRRLSGVVRRVDRLAPLGDRLRARVYIVPALWALEQRRDSRIFQGRSTVEIVQDVLASAGLYRGDALALELRRTYAPREYCVQYRETDLAFVTRLLEEDGVAFYFRHEGDAETLVLTDANTWALVATMDRQPVPYVPAFEQSAPVELLRALDARRELRPTSVTLREFSPLRPLATPDFTRAFPRAATEAAGARAQYDHPGRFLRREVEEDQAQLGIQSGSRQSELRYLEQQLDAEAAEGHGNVSNFTPGMVFDLLGHEVTDLDGRHLITRVVHHVRAAERVAGGDTGARPDKSLARYWNEFECVPARVAYVPPRRTPRPMILATQTATVVGPASEEIHTDALGRVKLLFHWDRARWAPGESSCWVRVAQAWAGAQWGALTVPRIGMEVVVTFLEGDPDRPLVVGCVYNGQKTPPHELPLHRSRTTLRTNSTPATGGYNELTFEDAAGAEEVYLRAERDLREEVLHDHAETVGHDRTARVGADDRLEVTGDREALVRGDERARVLGTRTEVVAGDASAQVEGNRVDVVSGRESRRVAGDLTTRVGGSEQREVAGTSESVARADQIVRVQGHQVTVVGSSGAPRSRVVHVEGRSEQSSTGAAEIRSDDEILLRCGRSMVRITLDGVEIHAPQIRLCTAGATLTLAERKAKLRADAVQALAEQKVVLKSPGASLGLDADAKLAGAKVQLGASSSAVDDDPELSAPLTTIAVTDQDGRPMRDQRYVLISASGEERSGVTDKDGCAATELAGSWSITLPDAGSSLAE